MANSADLATVMAQATDPMHLMQRITDRTLELIQVATGVMVGLVDDEGVTYVCGAGHRVWHVGTRVALDSSLSGLTVLTGEIQQSPDTEQDPRVDRDACRRLSVASLVCIPLKRGSATMGVLAVNSSTPNAFTQVDVDTLTTLAAFISTSVTSACDIADASAELLDLGRPAPTSSGGAGRPTDPTTRYVMSVLSDDAAGLIDATERIQHAMDDPTVLSMVFQPIVALATDTTVAVEALARFAVTPYMPPDLWFEEARRCGFGIELEMRAIELALAQLDAIPAGVGLSLNAGPEVATSPRFVAAVSAVPVERIILELTEHTQVEDYPSLVSGLRDLRRRGMRIAIDDTGAGYSSLAHILKLAPEFIKLDRELTSGVDLDPVRRALATSLVTFAAETGAQIIAEGVETADELEVLRELGISHAQGFHLARPAPLARAFGSESSTSNRHPDGVTRTD